MELYQRWGTKHHSQVQFLCFLQTLTSKVSKRQLCDHIFCQESFQRQVQSSIKLLSLHFSNRVDRGHQRQNFHLKKLAQANFNFIPPVAPPYTTICNESTAPLPWAALGEGAIPDPIIRVNSPLSYLPTLTICLKSNQDSRYLQWWCTCQYHL